MLHEQLKDQVPIPRVFARAKDGGQVFIYMSLIEGATLQERWSDINEDERQSVCEELKHMVKVWRALEQDSHGHYIGSLGTLPLNVIFLSSHPELTGPFQGANAVQQFQDVCGTKIFPSRLPCWAGKSRSLQNTQVLRDKLL